MPGNPAVGLDARGPSSRHAACCVAAAMTLDPVILRTSFDLVIERRPDLTVRFYQILFERDPALAPMFRRDRAAQAKMLAGAIAAVLDHLDDAPWLAATLGQ